MQSASLNCSISGYSDRCHLLVDIVDRIYSHYTQQPTSSSCLQSTNVAMFRNDCCHWIYSLQKEQMEH